MSVAGSRSRPAGAVAPPPIDAVPVRRGGLSRLRHGTSRGWQHVRAGDFPRLLHSVLGFVPGRVFHYDRLHVIESAEGPAPARGPAELPARLAGPADVAALEVLAPRGAGVYERRLSEGALGIVCHDDAGLCGMAWLGLGGAHPERDKFCTFLTPRDSAFTFDVSVPTRMQGRGIGTQLFRECVRYAQEHGRRRVLGYASWGNRPSLRACGRAGYRRVRTITVLSLLGIRIHRLHDPEWGRGARTWIGIRRSARVPVAPDRPSGHS